MASSERSNMCSAGENAWSAKQQIEWLHANCPAGLLETKKATKTKAAVVTAPSKKAVGLWYNHIMTHIFDYASAGYCVKLGQSNRIGRLVPSSRKYKAPGASKAVLKTRVAFKASSTLVITPGDLAAAKARSGKPKPTRVTPGSFPEFIRDKKGKKPFKELAVMWKQENPVDKGAKLAREKAKLAREKAKLAADATQKERGRRISDGELALKQAAEAKAVNAKAAKAKTAKAKAAKAGAGKAPQQFTGMTWDPDIDGTGTSVKMLKLAMKLAQLKPPAVYKAAKAKYEAAVEAEEASQAAEATAVKAKAKAAKAKAAKAKVAKAAKAAKVKATAGKEDKAAPAKAVDDAKTGFESVQGGIYRFTERVVRGALVKMNAPSGSSDSDIWQLFLKQPITSESVPSHLILPTLKRGVAEGTLVKLKSGGYKVAP
jgi:hypothetical protein